MCSVFQFSVFKPPLYTVGIWIPETFEYQTFWSLDFKWFGFSNGWSIGYVLCTRPTIRILDQYIITRWCQFVRYSNGIRKQDHLASNLFSTIWKFNDSTKNKWHKTVVQRQYSKQVEKKLVNSTKISDLRSTRLLDFKLRRITRPLFAIRKIFDIRPIFGVE